MSIKEHIKAKASSRTSDTAKQSLLPPRPFSEAKPSGSVSSKPQAPDAETKRERVKPAGFSFGNVRMMAGRLKVGAMGRSLPEIIRRKMEAAFNTDFTTVRVHEDDKASSVGALAYTQGEDIHFAPGEYQPGSPSGQKLIGHELTHILQQRAGRARVPRGASASINADPALEAEASALGTKAAQLKSFTEAGSALLQRHIRAGVSTSQGNAMVQPQHQPIQCGYRYDHVNKRFWKEDPNDKPPENHPEGYTDVTGDKKLQLKSASFPTPKPPSEDVLRGGKEAELFARSEASVKRKVERHDKAKVNELVKKIEEAPQRPSTSKEPIFSGTSFFHQALAVQKAQPTASKLQTFPKVYTNTRALNQPAGPKMKISPPEMLVDPGEKYTEMMKNIPPKIKALQTPLSAPDKMKEFFNFLDKPTSKMPSTIPKKPSSAKKESAKKESVEKESVEKESVKRKSGTTKKEKEPLIKKQRVTKQSKSEKVEKQPKAEKVEKQSKAEKVEKQPKVEAEPEEDPKVKAQKEIESSRELLGFKHLTMGVEGFRREGVHMANRILIESEKEKPKPDIGVLIGEKQGIMAPSVSTQWHSNSSVNQAQLLKFGEVASTAQTLGAKKGEDTPLSDLAKSLEQLKKAYMPKDLPKDLIKPAKEIKKSKKRKDPEVEELPKQKEVEKAVVKNLNRYSKEKEALDFIPSGDESETDDEDNPQSYQVTREKGEASTSRVKKKRRMEKGGRQVRVTPKTKAVMADDSPQYSNFVKASKLDNEELQRLHQEAGSVKALQEKLEEQGLEMTDKHVKQLLVDKGLQKFKGFKKNK